MKFYFLITFVLMQLAIVVNAQKLGSKKNEDISLANSNNYSIRENGENRICIYPSKSSLDWKNEIYTCIKYNKDGIAIVKDYYYPTLLEAEGAFVFSQNEYTSEISPYIFYTENLGGGKRFNPKTKEYIQILIEKNKNWYCITYSY